MTYTKDLSTQPYHLPDHPLQRAVGWLAKEHPFQTETPSDELVRRLWKIRTVNTLACMYPDTWLLFSLFGVHRCEFCEDFVSSGYSLIPGKDVVYVAPGMLAHYVEVHHYKPPEGFVDAVLTSPSVDSPAYKAAFDRLLDDYDADG